MPIITPQMVEKRARDLERAEENQIKLKNMFAQHQRELATLTESQGQTQSGISKEQANYLAQVNAYQAGGKRPSLP